MTRRSPAAPSCLVAGALLLLALTAAGGPGEAPAPATRLVLESGGALELSNSLEGAAVFSARDMRPGATAAGTVSVSNTGGVDGALSLSQANLVDAPGPFGGRLPDHLRLAVEEIGAAGSASRSLYSGALSGLGTRALGVLRAGETRTYRFTVTFPDTDAPPGPGTGDNLFQSASLQVDYVWTASEARQSALTLELSGKRKQRPLRRRRLVVQARCSSACSITGSARVRRASGVRRLRARRTAVPAGRRKRLTFKLSPRKAGAVARVLRARKRAVAVVKVTATGSAAKVTAKRRIVLIR